MARNSGSPGKCAASLLSGDRKTPQQVRESQLQNRNCMYILGVVQTKKCGQPWDRMKNSGIVRRFHSGDLTEEEKTKLQKHLAVCPECREALKEYQVAAEISCPFCRRRIRQVRPPKQMHGQLMQRQPRSGSALRRGDRADSEVCVCADGERERS